MNFSIALVKRLICLSLVIDIHFLEIEIKNNDYGIGFFANVIPQEEGVTSS
jgi:hypothetical protein